VDFAPRIGNGMVIAADVSPLLWLSLGVLCPPRVIDCWSCGLKRATLPLRRFCTRACGEDGSGDGAAPSVSALCLAARRHLPTCWTSSTSPLDARGFEKNEAAWDKTNRRKMDKPKMDRHRMN
jgi:hypothetical protein